MCQKSSWACRNAKSLFERSEFDLADTETTNFWQRSRHSLDFSLILDFAHVQQIENKFSFVFTQPQNCLSFLLVKQKKWKSKKMTQIGLRFYGIVENGVLYSFVVCNSLIVSMIVLFIIFYLT